MKRHSLTFSKELWSSMPATLFCLAGVAVSYHDFVTLHQRAFHAPAVTGAVLLFLIGIPLEIWVRGTLIEKAGFSDLLSTKRLQIVDNHKLMTDGIFGLIRHPLYLGRLRTRPKIT